WSGSLCSPYLMVYVIVLFTSRRRHTRSKRDWSSDVCSSDLTHATLRFAFEELDDSYFDNSLLAIDEFHHVSREDSSVLGNALRSIMNNSTAHILAMTGSYFRGDSTQILEPSYEDKFDKVTYTYYEKLEAYQHLKSFAFDF